MELIIFYIVEYVEDDVDYMEGVEVVKEERPLSINYDIEEPPNEDELLFIDEKDLSYSEDPYIPENVEWLEPYLEDSGYWDDLEDQ